MARYRFDPDQEARIVAQVLMGEPVKRVAFEWEAPCRTVYDVLKRAGVSPKATTDPDLLRLREKWARNQRALRERRRQG